jgi:hypothetical protein
MSKIEHIHLPFKYGHITWHDTKNLPSGEQLEIFTKMAERAFDKFKQEPKINNNENDLPIFK